MGMGMARGLTHAEAALRLAQYGPNRLPQGKPSSFLAVFLRQFLSPLIYILFAAALVSLVLGDVTDAAFIGVVLLVNGIVGAVQEFSAGRAAEALKALEQPHAVVIREGGRHAIDAALLVPGDWVLLESGGRVPADIMLETVSGLQCDESLLTGESRAVKKSGGMTAYAGSIVMRGRGEGYVSATGTGTHIGHIAAHLAVPSQAEPPLLIRMGCPLRDN